MIEKNASYYKRRSEMAKGFINFLEALRDGKEMTDEQAAIMIAGRKMRKAISEPEKATIIMAIDLLQSLLDASESGTSSSSPDTTFIFPKKILPDGTIDATNPVTLGKRALDKIISQETNKMIDMSQTMRAMLREMRN